MNNEILFSAPSQNIFGLVNKLCEIGLPMEVTATISNNYETQIFAPKISLLVLNLLKFVLF